MNADIVIFCITMRLPTTEQIESLPHAELVALVTELIVAVRQGGVGQGTPLPTNFAQLLATTADASNQSTTCFIV